MPIRFRNATGSVQLLVADGTRASADDQRELARRGPRSVPQLIRALNRSRRNNRLYVRLLDPDAGAVVNGEPLAVAAAVGARACIEADRSGGSFHRCASAPLGEWERAARSGGHRLRDS